MNSSLANKKIILGITGSIAAYKAALVLRLLVKAGAEVKVIMTESATQFITPLTLATLSKNEVTTAVSSEQTWNNHVEMGLWADVLLVAPATAQTLAKLSYGFCDNALSAVYLSAKCPTLLAPAMDLDMWKHPATQQNIARLKSFGNQIIPVGHGELASGLVGDGRMAEPQDILLFLEKFFQAKQDFLGKKILVTAGPTFEPLDPVRYIGNHSSGKMGIAIAEELANRGAEVHLLLGPTKVTTQHSNIKLEKVQTAAQMNEAAQRLFPSCDVAILAAAVADYRPKHFSEQKIKKKEAEMFIELEKTPDIAAGLGAIKKPKQVLIGFALETNNEVENAQAKLAKKNFDFIVLNSLNDAGAGFHHDTNKIRIIHQNNIIREFELKTKAAVATDIADELLYLWSKHQ